MSRLVPLLHDGADDLEQLLLEAAREDVPPDGAARAETLAALRAVSATAAATGTGVFGLKWLESLGPVATKWMAIGMMGTSAVLATHLVASGRTGTSSVPRPLARVVAAPVETPGVVLPARAGRPAVQPVEVVDTPNPAPATSAPGAMRGAVAPLAAHVAAPGSVAGFEPANAGAGVPGPPTLAELPLVASSPSAAPVPSSSLGDEVALLEPAREALTSSRPNDALASLDVYQARFPSGDLREEGVLLRVRALLAARRTTDARRLADDFVQKNPKSTYAPRIRSLLDRKP